MSKYAVITIETIKNKYFIEANSKQEARKFVMEEGCGFDNIEIDHTEKFVEVLKENADDNT